MGNEHNCTLNIWLRLLLLSLFFFFPRTIYKSGRCSCGVRVCLCMFMCEIVECMMNCVKFTVKRVNSHISNDVETKSNEQTILMDAWKIQLQKC